MNNRKNKKNDEPTGFFTRDGGDLLDQFDRGVFAYYFRESQKASRGNRKQSKRRRVNKNKYNN
ncbi:MAG: hypothetical protein WCO09_00335 [bacterium]